MIIKIIKEQPDMYFVKVLGKQGRYAQGTNMQDAFTNLADTIRLVEEVKSETTTPSTTIEIPKQLITFQPYIKKLQHVRFRSIELEI